MTIPNFCDFLCERLGSNYTLVHARRKAARYDHRGFLQQQVTHAEHTAAVRAYREAHGEPYDAERAALYRALKALAEDPAVKSAMSFKQYEAATAALAAEVAR